MVQPDFYQVIDRYHRAAAEFLKGDPEPYKTMFSQREDVTLANPFAPFGPISLGWEQVADTMERGASNYRDGEVTSFENVATCVTPELAYIVEVERFKAKVGGSADFADVALRTTSILRPEDGGWKIAHRHADPIVSARPAESVVQK